MTGYYHEFMLKDRPHLCQYMPPCKDARRLVADPKNEPNFYRISRQYPLDGEAPPSDEVTNIIDQPAAKRARSDSMALPQGLVMGTPSFTTAPLMGQSGIANVGGPSPAALLGLMQGGASNVPDVSNINQTAALLSILEAQNKRRQEQEQQRAMLAAALLQQQQRNQPAGSPVPSNNSSLSAMLSMLGGGGQH